MTGSDTPHRTVPAANADVLGDDARTDGTMDQLSDPPGAADGSPGGRGQPDQPRPGERGEARPGKDENQAGFLKEKDQPGG